MDGSSSCRRCRFATFSTNAIVRLKNDDFSTQDKALIALNYSECFIVLFYNENAESKKLTKIWNKVAQQTPGPVFGACNILLETKVVKAFSEINKHPNHPFKPYVAHEWPIIIVYRDGYPVGTYSGSRDAQAISNWAVTLACNIGVKEDS